MNITPMRRSFAADNLPREPDTGDAHTVHGITGEQISLTRYDGGAVLAVDDGLRVTDAHLCIDRLRQLRAAVDAVIAEIEGRPVLVGRIVPGSPGGDAA